MYVMEYGFTDGTASRSINMADTPDMAIEMLVADHLDDHDWLDRIGSAAATEVKAWAQRCPVATYSKRDLI